MIIAEGRLAVIIRTTRASPAKTLATDILRPTQNIALISKNYTFNTHLSLLKTKYFPFITIQEVTSISLSISPSISLSCIT